MIVLALLAAFLLFGLATKGALFVWAWNVAVWVWSANPPVVSLILLVPLLALAALFTSGKSRYARTSPPKLTLSKQSRGTREERRLDEIEVDHLVHTWRKACEGVGLLHKVDSAFGESIITPKITDITLGPPTVIRVELLPGQLMGDVSERASRLAPALGVRQLRVTKLGDLRVEIELLRVDPLDVESRLPDEHLISVQRPVFTGTDEDGFPRQVTWSSAPHTIVQGVTGSGKSWWLYGLLAQLASPKDVVVCGSDPSGLLWRPFSGSRHSPFQVSGLSHPQAHIDLLQTLVTEMDRRILTLPAHSDEVAVDETTPLLVVVMEEYPGLLRAVDHIDTKLGKQLRSLLSRLLAEGRKAGIRVIIVTQRAEANIIGGFERAMCSLRISFRTDNRDAVKLLHPGAFADQCDAHMTAEPGIALMTAPGVPLSRFRGPWIGRYANYCQLVGNRLSG